METWTALSQRAVWARKPGLWDLRALVSRNHIDAFLERSQNQRKILWLMWPSHFIHTVHIQSMECFQKEVLLWSMEGCFHDGAKAVFFPFLMKAQTYKYVSAQSYDFIYVHVLIRSIKQLFKGDICAFFQNILGTLYLALKVLWNSQCARNSGSIGRSRSGLDLEVAVANIQLEDLWWKKESKLCCPQRHTGKTVKLCLKSLESVGFTGKGRCQATFTFSRLYIYIYIYIYIHMYIYIYVCHFWYHALAFLAFWMNFFQNNER